MRGMHAAHGSDLHMRVLEALKLRSCNTSYTLGRRPVIFLGKLPKPSPQRPSGTLLGHQTADMHCQGAMWFQTQTQQHVTCNDMWPRPLKLAGAEL